MGDQSHAANSTAGHEFMAELTSARWIRCFAALTLMFLSSWLLNQFIFPRFTLVLGMAREISTVGSCVTYLVIAVAASLRPEIFTPRRIALCIAGFFAAGFVLVLVGLTTSNPSALVIGGFSMSAGRALASLCACVMLVEVGVSASALCAAGSLALAYLLHGAFIALPPFVGIAVFTAAPFAIVALSQPHVAKLLEQMHHRPSAAALALTEPRSFLPFAHVLFVSLFAFRIAYGYSLTFGAVESTPLFTLLPLLPLGFVAAQVIVAGRAAPADILYQGACLFVLAGFLAVLVPQTAATAVPNMLLATGGDCFSVLMYYALAAIGRRNLLQALPIFAWGQCASSSGLLAGTSLGHLTNGLFAAGSAAMPAMVALVVFAFTALNLTALRGFRFERTIAGVESVPQLVVPDIQASPYSPGVEGVDFIDTQCEQLAQRYSLTERELDVFRLLAHGRNVPFIEGELIISRNTIKTHIKHLYQKMDLHSQQELIDMVETY